VASNTNREGTICKVGLQPEEGGITNFKNSIDAKKEGVVVYGIKRCAEIERNDDGRFTQIRVAENVIRCVKIDVSVEWRRP